MNRIGLALSGGGFRASLYHLGLVRFLRDADILPRVTHITSVSGGSVLAAHLALNWDRYSGSPNEFDSAAAEMLSFVRLDVRNRIIRRFPLALALRWPRRLFGRSNRRLSRTGLLEYHYEKYLFGDTSLFQLPGTPQLHILATNVSEGCLCSFNRDGLIMVRRGPGNATRLDRVTMGLATVAMAVAASSAFPGFFPPHELTAADVGAKSGEFDRQAYTDGGVFDNLGVRMFRCLERQMLTDGGLTPDDFFDLSAALEALRQAGASGRETPLGRFAKLLVADGLRPDLPQLADPATVGAIDPSADASSAPSTLERMPGDAEGRLLARLSDILRHYHLDRDPLFAGLVPPDRGGAVGGNGRFDQRILNEQDQLWLNRRLLDAAFRQATGRGCFRRLDSGIDGVLVSDVGKPFEVQTARQTGGLMRTAMRATDIVMDRVWQLEIETFAGTPGFVFAPLTEVVEPAEDPTVLHPEIQRQIAGVRTDLDRFSDLEISSLVRHGYCVARKACRARPDLFGDRLPEGQPWDPIPEPLGAARPTVVAARPVGSPPPPVPATVEARALQASAGRRIWSTLLDRRDWVSYLYVPIIVPILFLLPYAATRYYRSSHHKNQIMNSLSQDGRDLAEMSRLLDQGPEPRWTGVAAEEVNKLEEPDWKGFTVVQDSWITDLRHWKPDGTVRNDPDSYAYHSRRLTVMKSADNSTNHVFRWRMLPRDPNVQFRFPHQELPAVLRKCFDTDRSPAGERLCRWQVDFDFRDVPPGQLVSLIVEHQGAGRYLEDNPDSTNVPLNVRADTAELTAWILMPENREYKNFRVVRRDKVTGNAEPVNVVTKYMSSDNSIIAFKLLSLKAGSDYEVIWTYK